MTPDKALNAKLKSFLKKNKEWRLRYSSDSYIDFDRNFKINELETISVVISLDINLKYFYGAIPTSHPVFIVLNANLINEIERLTNNSFKKLSEELPDYRFNEFNILEDIDKINIEINEFVNYIDHEKINDFNETQLMTLLKTHEFKNKKEYVMALINSGADILFENQEGHSVKSILLNTKELPDYLEALKEKILLEETIGLSL